MVAWLTAKVVAICLGLTATAFCVATIVLAVENANLEDDLQDARDKLEVILAATTTPSPPATISPGATTPGETSPGGDTTPSGGTTPGGGGTTPGGGGTTPGGGGTTPGGEGTTPGGEGTTPGGGTTPSLTTKNPNPIFPTLPTGLPKPEDIITAEHVAIFFGILSTCLIVALVVVVVHRDNLWLQLSEASEKLDVLEDYIQATSSKHIKYGK